MQCMIQSRGYNHRVHHTGQTFSATSAVVACGTSATGTVTDAASKPFKILDMATIGYALTELPPFPMNNDILCTEVRTIDF